MLELQPILQTISDRLETSANVKNIFGEPITVEGKTIIPVAKIGYGFGAGGGEGERTEDESSSDAERHGNGGGGGGGVGALPVGVIEVSAEETRFVPIGDPRRQLGLLLGGIAIGFAMAKIFSRH